jgi:alpha-beta hydrolase superfamily lysophospholipase
MQVQWRDHEMSTRKWLKAFLVTLSMFVLVYAVARPALHSYLITHPRRLQAELTQGQTGLPVERVAFRTADSIELNGWFVAAQGDGGTIVVSHGLGTSGAASYPAYAFLNRAGHNLLLIDHRAQGHSGGRTSTLGPLEVGDMLAAVSYLRTRPDVDPGRIGAIGCSMGAGVVLGAAAREPTLRAVVAESVYADLGQVWDRFGRISVTGTSLSWSWGAPMRWAARLWTGEWPSAFAPVDLIAQISPRPLLLIHGEHDNGACTVADAQRLFAAAREPKELWIVPGAGHCNAHALQPQAYEDRVTAFFARALAPE